MSTKEIAFNKLLSIKISFVREDADQMISALDAFYHNDVPLPNFRQMISRRPDNRVLLHILKEIYWDMLMDQAV